MTVLFPENLEKFLIATVTKHQGNFDAVSETFIGIAKSIDNGRWNHRAEETFSAKALAEKFRALTTVENASHTLPSIPDKNKVLNIYAGIANRLPACVFSESDEEGEKEIPSAAMSAAPKEVDPYGRGRLARERMGVDEEISSSSEEESVYGRDSIRKNWGRSHAALGSIDWLIDIEDPADSEVILKEEFDESDDGNLCDIEQTGRLDPFDPNFDVQIHLSEAERIFYSSECERRRGEIGDRMGCFFQEHEKSIENGDSNVLPQTNVGPDETAAPVILEIAHEPQSHQQMTKASPPLKSPFNVFKFPDLTSLTGYVLPWSIEQPTTEEISILSNLLETAPLAAFQSVGGRLCAALPTTWNFELNQDSTAIDSLRCVGSNFETSEMSEGAVVCFLRPTGEVRGAVGFLLEAVYRQGLYLSGIRRGYIKEHGNFSSAPTSATLTAFRKSGDLLDSLYFRGPKAQGILKKLIGPSDPILARRTDPKSLNAIFGDSRGSGVAVISGGGLAELRWLFGGDTENAYSPVSVLPLQRVFHEFKFPGSSEGIQRILQQSGQKLLSASVHHGVCNIDCMREGKSSESAKESLVNFLHTVVLKELPISPNQEEPFVFAAFTRDAWRSDSLSETIEEIITHLSARIVTWKFLNEPSDSLKKAIKESFDLSYNSCIFREGPVLLIGFENVESRKLKSFVKIWRNQFFVSNSIFFAEKFRVPE